MAETERTGPARILKIYGDNSERNGSKPSRERLGYRPAAEPAGRQAYSCLVCKDLRWVYHDVPTTHAEFGKAHRCVCQTSGDGARMREYLLRIDGLTDRERRLRFVDLVVTPDNQEAWDAAFTAVERLRGLVTLVGQPGLGKSSLLVCAVNAARDERRVKAVYTKVASVLEYLRNAYHPEKGDLSFDGRWDLLVNCDVLALDELTRFNATPWALEKFHALLDERWRNMDRRVTLLATNGGLGELDESIASRLQDGRARVVTLAGQDMRPLAEWDE